MYSLIVLSVTVAAVTAVTPFFESPDNHKAAAFYKTPAHGQHSGPAPAPGHYQPAPAPAHYQPAPAPAHYQPAYKPAYQPAPAYKPAPAHYQPAPAYKPTPAPYQPAYKPAYKSEGATSFQSVKLENVPSSGYKHSY